MKKALYLFAILAITFACSSKQEATEEASVEEEEESMYSYTGSFEMGDPAHQQLVRDMLEAFKKNDMDAVRTFFADSVSISWSSGNEFDGTLDSLISMVTNYRNSLNSLDVVYLASMAVKSTEHGHEWALSWTYENHAGEDGDNASVFQENFYIEDGKIRSIRQYRALPIDPTGEGNTPEQGDTDYTYSGSFELSDSANVDIVIGLNDAVAALNMEEIEAHFADSVTIYGHDGFYFDGTRDSLMSMAREWFGEMSSIENDYIASLPVRSDKDHDWVLLWYESESTKKDGTTNEGIFHEDYLIEDGKVRVIRAYKRDLKEEEMEEAGEES